MRPATLALLLVGAAALIAVKSFAASDAVRLTDVTTLTLHNGRMTAGRRSRPIPQIQCVGGGGCSSFVPSVIQCRNVGFDGRDVQWECKAELPNEYRLGRTTVSCEGYSYPDDPYILQGSCGVEYEMFHNSGQNSGYTQQGYAGGYSNDYYYDQSASSSGAGFFFSLVVFILVLWACAKCCTAPPAVPVATAAYPSAGYGAGSSFATPGYGYATPGVEPGVVPSAAPGGFWTGAGLGGTLGYLWGRRNNNYYNNGGWGGWGRGSSSGWGSSSGGRGGGSSSTGSHTSTGYGGTTRR